MYAVAGAIENLTGETEEGMAVREIKKLGTVQYIILIYFVNIFCLKERFNHMVY